MDGIIKKYLLIITLAVLGICRISAYAGELRTWTSKSGKSVQAVLTETNQYTIILKTTDNKYIKILKSRLSQSDLNYLNKLAAIDEFSEVLKDNIMKLHGTIKNIIGKNIILNNPEYIKITYVPYEEKHVKRLNHSFIEKKQTIALNNRRIPIIILDALRSVDFIGSNWSGMVYPCGIHKLGKNKRQYRCFSPDFQQAKQMLLKSLKTNGENTKEEEISAELIREKLIEPFKRTRRQHKPHFKIEMK